jgi:vancomycin resistance protein YoaR
VTRHVEKKKSHPPKKNGQTRRTSAKGDRAPAAFRWGAFLLFILVVFSVAFYDVLGAPGKDNIGKGVYIGPIDSSGKTSDDAARDLEEFLGDYSLTFVAGERRETLGPFPLTEPPVVSFRPSSAVESAFLVGRNDNGALALAERLGAAVFGTNISVPYSLDEDSFLERMREKFSPMVGRAKNARLDIQIRSDGYDVDIIEEKSGVFFETDSLIEQTKDRLRNLSDEAVKVSVIREEPQIVAEDLEPLVDDVDEIMSRVPRTITFGGMSWELTAGQLANWIVPIDFGDGPMLGLDHGKMKEQLESRAAEIRIEPQDAVFKEEEGKVIEFSPGINGESLDIDASIVLLESVFLLGEKEEGLVDLPLMVVEPEITTEKSNPYGIKDIIGVGESNFRGSPSNRRHNIKTGAASVHGTLIPPGEEFSLLATLGEIDGEHGYLEELVIKENETKPEYGGGLCQIGTTAFRTALNSGLPVTQRRNHSYRVPYYERDGDGNYMGPGVDATIYDPAPDFRFMNDTEYHLLFMTDIDGNRLTFTLWGVNDGRVAERGEVSVWDITEPPEKKEIRTTEIPSGTYKCTESPHSGARTKFTYTVTYPDGEVIEDEIYSHYKPWGEVCLIGMTEEELAAWEAEQAAIEAGEIPVEGEPGGTEAVGIDGIVG